MRPAGFPLTMRFRRDLHCRHRPTPNLFLQAVCAEQVRLCYESKARGACIRNPAAAHGGNWPNSTSLPGNISSLRTTSQGFVLVTSHLRLDVLYKIQLGDVLRPHLDYPPLFSGKESISEDDFSKRCHCLQTPCFQMSLPQAPRHRGRRQTSLEADRPPVSFTRIGMVTSPHVISVI
jgi:hypothetical protein